MNDQPDLLQEEVLSPYKRRRQLLPWWIRFFIWIFFVFGAIVPVSAIAAIFGVKFQISLYGLETNDPLSVTGMLLIILYLLKAVVAYGLWTEKDWAIKLGLVDAMTGIAICIYTMIIFPLINNDSGFVVNFRLEIIFLILFLIKLRNINTNWQNLSHSTE